MFKYSLSRLSKGLINFMWIFLTLLISCVIIATRTPYDQYENVNSNTYNPFDKNNQTNSINDAHEHVDDNNHDKNSHTNDYDYDYDYDYDFEFDFYYEYEFNNNYNESEEQTSYESEESGFSSSDELTNE